MDPKDILSTNHDIHMHSRDFSDGMHSVQDVVRFATRWQANPRWAGVSDHSPLLDEKLQNYILKLKPIQEELYNQDGIELLAGMELEWGQTGPACSDLTLSGLDYIIAGFHGRNFSEADQAEMYFHHVAHHPYTDGVAHPDRFLGSVNTLSIGWEKIFNDFYDGGVLCEYNLTTPLHSEILEIAILHSDVKFMINSDTHDFRSIAVRRVIDAWSELLGGGYQLAREYLNNLLNLTCSPEQKKRLAGLFGTEQLLDDLQRRLYQHSLIYRADSIYLSPEEEMLIQILESIPECDLDKDFLIHRLDRFSTLPTERIASCLDVVRFKEMINSGRQERVK